MSEVSAMSAYEMRAWAKAVERLNRRDESPARRAVSRVTKPIGAAARTAWAGVPLHEDVEGLVADAVQGLFKVTFGPAEFVNLDEAPVRGFY